MLRAVMSQLSRDNDLFTLTHRPDTRNFQIIVCGDKSPPLHVVPGHVKRFDPIAPGPRREAPKTGTVGTSQPKNPTAAGKSVTASNATAT